MPVGFCSGKRDDSTKNATNLILFIIVDTANPVKPSFPRLRGARTMP